MKILMLVYNTFESDSRVYRTARSLGEAGHEVLLVAKHRRGLAEHETQEGFRLRRIDPSSPEFYAAPGTDPWYVRAVFSVVDSFSRFVHEQLKFDRWPGAARAPFTLVRRGGDRLRSVLRMIRRSYLFVEVTGEWLRLRRRKVSTSWWRVLMGRLENEFVSTRFSGYNRFASALHQIAESFRPDFVHAHDFNTLPAALLIHERMGVPFAYDSHELWLERNRAGGLNSGKERMRELEVERKAIRKAAFTITVSQGIADYLEQNYSSRSPPCFATRLTVP
jgi:hypothetical protein